MTLREFQRWYDENRSRIQDELYRRADEETNGRDEFYELLGREIEEHPVVSPRAVRGT